MSTSRSEPTVDLNQPASSVLRAGTVKIHDEINKSKAATYLTNGELDREDYVRYLMMLWRTYKYSFPRRCSGVWLIRVSFRVLEDGLTAHANDRVLSPTYNPALLARVSALSSDISYFLEVRDDDDSWKTHERYKSLISSPPPAFQAYISRLNQIIEEDPRRLLAHSYIRYMGDLSGGQIIKSNIRKAYSLIDDRGTKFYDFAVLGSEGQTNPAPASKGQVKNIKEWFKNGIDAGVGNDVEMKGLWAFYIQFVITR
jgi:heme oxygenase (biliverdin-producing, ferredoxin)